MRRILEFVSLAALAYLLAETAYAFLGPSPLAGPIPTHFNLAGRPNAWGSTRMLWLLPAIASVLYLLMTWVARHPAAFNFPVRVTPFNRGRLEAIAVSMTVWLKAELIGFFAFIQWTLLRAAHSPGRGIPAVYMPWFLVLVFLTVGLHFAAILRAGRARP